MEQALRAKLLETAALTAIVGGAVDWGVGSSGSPLPGLRLFEISGTPGMTYAGGSGWVRSRVQADSWGKTYRQAWEIAEVLGGRQGLLVGLRETIGEIRLRTFVLNRRTSTDTVGGNVAHCHSLDVLVWHAAA